MPPHPKPDTIDFLLAQICHLHHGRAHALLEALGLYRGQPPLLRALWDEDGLTQSELADRLRIAPATITRMIQRMEKAGFLTRRPDPDDQRVMHVHLTGLGQAVRAEVERVWITMEAETFAGFSPEELEQLRRFLLQVRSNLLRVSGPGAD